MFGLQFVTAVTISAAFVFGMVLALLGSLKLALAKRLDLGEGYVGGLLAALNLSLMPMMLVTGLLVDRYGVRWVLISGSILTSVAIASLGFRPSYARAFAAILLAGFGSAGLSASSIVLMQKAFWGVHQASASQNLGNVFFALGALVTPVLADMLLRALEFRRYVAVIATLCLVPAFLAALAGADELKLADQPAELNQLFSDRTLWLAAGVFFLYAPLEGAIGVWTTTYLTELGHGGRSSTWVLSGFWATFLTSRLAAALLLHGLYTQPNWRWLCDHDAWLIVLPAVLVAAVLGNLAGAAKGAGGWRGILLLGFLLGPIFPTLVGNLFRSLDAAGVRGFGTAYGVLFAFGSLGSLLLAPVIAARANRRSVQSAFRIPMGIALALAAVALVFALVF